MKSKTKKTKIEKEFTTTNGINWERVMGLIFMIGTFIVWFWGIIAYDNNWGTVSKIVWSIFCLILILDFSSWGRK